MKIRKRIADTYCMKHRKRTVKRILKNIWHIIDYSGYLADSYDPRTRSKIEEKPIYYYTLDYKTVYAVMKVSSWDKANLFLGRNIKYVFIGATSALSILEGYLYFNLIPNDFWSKIIWGSTIGFRTFHSLYKTHFKDVIVDKVGMEKIKTV